MYNDKWWGRESDKTGYAQVLDMGGCGDLNENGPHKLIYSNAWSPVGGSVQEGLEGVDLEEAPMPGLPPACCHPPRNDHHGL